MKKMRLPLTAERFSLSNIIIKACLQHIATSLLFIASKQCWSQTSGIFLLNSGIRFYLCEVNVLILRNGT